MVSNDIDYVTKRGGVVNYIGGSEGSPEQPKGEDVTLHQRRQLMRKFFRDGYAMAWILPFSEDEPQISLVAEAGKTETGHKYSFYFSVPSKESADKREVIFVGIASNGEVTKYRQTPEDKNPKNGAWGSLVSQKVSVIPDGSIQEQEKARDYITSLMSYAVENGETYEIDEHSQNCPIYGNPKDSRSR